MDTKIMNVIRRLIRVLVTLIIVGILANDGWQAGTSIAKASDGMNAAMKAALDYAAQAPDDTAGARGVAMKAAQALGTNVESYSQVVGDSLGSRSAQVTLKVSAPMGRTVVAAAIMGAVEAAPQADWYTKAHVSLSETKKVDVYGGK